MWLEGIGASDLRLWYGDSVLIYHEYINSIGATFENDQEKQTNTYKKTIIALACYQIHITSVIRTQTPTEPVATYDVESP